MPATPATGHAHRPIRSVSTGTLNVATRRQACPPDAASSPPTAPDHREADMKASQPPPASEYRARRIVKARSGGHLCEITGAIASDMSHRKARSAGGQWQPSNLLHLAHDVHMWLEANPRLADAGGWHVPSWADPLDVPVWLNHPWPAWFVMDNRGFLTSIDPEDFDLPAVPVLPERRAA